MQSCFASIKIMQTCFFFAGRRCQRNVDPLRQRQMQQALQGLQGLHDDPRSLWRHQGEQWSRSHDELNQFRWSRWSNPWTRWTISPRGMKLVKVCEISQVVRFYCLTFWTSIMWTLIFIPFRDSTSLRHLEVCVFVVFQKVFLHFWCFIQCFAVRCHYAEEKHQCNQTWCWNVERQAVGSVRSVRRHFTIKLCGPFGPSASFGPLWPVWSFVIFLSRFLRRQSWVLTAQSKPVYHEQRCGKPNLPISFFGFWWVSRLSWTPRQWQIRPSKHEKLTSWNTCSFWEHTRRKHRQKHIQEMQLHTLPEFPEDLDVMVFNSFAMYF